MIHSEIFARAKFKLCYLMKIDFSPLRSLGNNCPFHFNNISNGIQRTCLCSSVRICAICYFWSQAKTVKILLYHHLVATMSNCKPVFGLVNSWIFTVHGRARSQFISDLANCKVIAKQSFTSIFLKQNRWTANLNLEPQNCPSIISSCIHNVIGKAYKP